MQARRWEAQTERRVGGREGDRGQELEEREASRRTRGRVEQERERERELARLEGMVTQLYAHIALMHKQMTLLENENHALVAQVLNPHA
jgi:hypothetical protein